MLGYRIMHKLECGRFMYIDDLITGPAARKMVWLHLRLSPVAVHMCWSSTLCTRWYVFHGMPMFPQGLAALLVDFALATAKAEGCSCVQLDSGEARHAAHRLYLNKGFRLEFHHFIHRLQ